MTVSIILGDCREQLRLMESESVHCCVTSPPYFNLRDYQVAGQIGLEPTPEAFVAEMVGVFREVRRVLRADGTLWLNLGDSYANDTKWGGSSGGKHVTALHGDTGIGRRKVCTGLKAKDLVGIPWAVAQALREPHYTGRIKHEKDRTWLAAMIDGEGTICGFRHIRADDGRPRTGVHVTITNSSTALLNEAARIWPTSRSEHMRPGAGHLGVKTTWRWIVHGIENKTLILRELYPYLIAKKRQALVAYNLLLLMAEAKRLGHSPQRDATRDRRKFLTDMISSLNQGEAVDIPSWLAAPPSPTEPGWYLRQDIIWHKPNPMPESVRDRCTKAHEYVFLLAKSERYFYDAVAIAEAAVGPAGGNTKPNKSFDHDPIKHRTKAGLAASQTKAREAGGFKIRNRRSVWSVTSEPFRGAHFATFPSSLIEPMILAGCPKGGTVLDPFGGAGTTGLVADRLGRNAVLIELNPSYADMARRRISGDAPLLADVVSA